MGTLTVAAIVAGYYVVSGQAFRDFANWYGNQDKKRNNNYSFTNQ